MTRRPDSTDLAQAAKRASRHRRCLCGDRQPCTCTPSQGWYPRWWVPVLWGDLRLVYGELAALKKRFTGIEEKQVATQDQVNALAQRVTDDVAAIRAEVDEIKAAHPEVDLSALETAVNSLHQTAVDIDPSPEAPAEPAADPVDGS